MLRRSAHPSENILGSETPRVHHAARRCGGVVEALKWPIPKTTRKARSGVRTSSPATNGIAAFAVTASCIRRWYANTLLMSTTKPCHQACMSTSRAQFGSERNSHRRLRAASSKRRRIRRLRQDSERFRSAPRTGRRFAVNWQPQGRNPHVRHETAGVHHASRRRGSVACYSARAADRKTADHRVLGLEHAFGHEPTGCCFCAAAARPRLDRGLHRRDRVSLGGGTQIARRRDRSRVRSIESRYHCRRARISMGLIHWCKTVRSSLTFSLATHGGSLHWANWIMG